MLVRYNVLNGSGNAKAAMASVIMSIRFFFFPTKRWKHKMYYIDNTRYTTLFCTIDLDQAHFTEFWINFPSIVQISYPDADPLSNDSLIISQRLKITSLFYEKSFSRGKSTWISRKRTIEGPYHAFLGRINVHREIPLCVTVNPRQGCFVDKLDPDGSARDIGADTGN